MSDTPGRNRSDPRVSMSGMDERTVTADKGVASSSSRVALLQRLGELPRWKTVILAGAAIVVLLGLGVRGFDAASVPDSSHESGQHTASNSPTIRGNSLVGGSPFPGGFPGSTSPEGGGAGGEGERPRTGTGSSNRAGPGGESEWSPAMLRGGFGFFLGFAIGMVLRTFFRMTAVVVGLNLLLLVGLSQAGWVEVRWDLIEGQFDHYVGRLGDELTALRTFVLGSIPTVGFSGLGIFTGFRKG